MGFEPAIQASERPQTARAVGSANGYYACNNYTGRFIMSSVITNIYSKKTKGPTLMELFTATGKLTRVWQQLEYRIDVCRVTRGAHIEHL